jgi:hypothetical protein
MIEVPDGYKVVVLAVVTAKRVIKTRTGNTMCVLSLEDENGAFEAVLFGSNGRGRDGPSPFERFAALCEPDTVALFAGGVERRNRGGGKPGGGGGGGGEEEGEEGAHPVGEDEDDGGGMSGMAESAPAIPGLIVSEVVPAARATELLVRAITVAIDATAATGDQIVQTERLITEHGGDRAQLTFSVHTGSAALTVIPGDRWKVHPSAALVEGLRRIWGEDAVLLELASAERLMAG